MVEVLTHYSKQCYHKMEQLTTIAAALKRIDAGRTRRRPQQATRPTQRYRLTDCFTPDELNQLVSRYQAGEMSTALAKESGIAKTTFLRLLAERGGAHQVAQADGRPRREDPPAPQAGDGHSRDRKARRL